MYVLPGHNMPAETLLVFCVSSFWTFWACLVAPRVGWLVAPPGWLVGCTTRLVGWLVAPPGLVNWLVGSLVGWLHHQVGWLVAPPGWLVGWLHRRGWLIGWLVRWLVGWLVVAFTHRLFGWLVGWLVLTNSVHSVHSV
jgi:hypothetical protein